MPNAPFPKDEADRLSRLHESGILDSAPEEIFDDLTRLAARLCETPIALISLVDAERQWFKSAFGLNVSETPRDWAFCAHAILENGPLIIEDATLDSRTSDNPLVTGPPNIRFYAGVPLRISSGQPLGTLCIIDTQPRVLSQQQLADLQSLARQATGQIELRSANHRLDLKKQALEASKERMDQIAAQVPGMVYQFLRRTDGSTCFPYASDGIRKIYRVSPDEVRENAEKVYEVLHPDDYDDVEASIDASARTLQPWAHEYRVCFLGGETRWLYGSATPTRQADNSVLWHGFITDITRLHVERVEVLKLRSQLQAIINASTQVAIIATDRDGMITVFNPGAERMLGYAAAEMVGRQTPARIHLESEVVSRGEQLSRETGRTICGFDVFVEYARQGRCDEREWTYIRKDGSRLTVNLAVTSIRDSDNVLTGFLGLATDVTAARSVDAELRTERQRLEMALAGGEFGTWDWNVQTGEECWDARWAGIIGESLDDLRPHVDEWNSRVHPEDLAGIWQKVQDHFAGQTQLYEAEFRIRHRNGTWRWVVARGRVMERDRRGRPLRMVGTMADITERIQAEAALKESESRFRALAEFAPIGIYQADAVGQFVYANDRWQEICGASSPECLGDGWLRCIHSLDRARVQSEWQEFVSSGAEFDVQFQCCLPNGNLLHVRSKARRVVSDDQSWTTIVGSTQDMTELHIKEAVLREQIDWFKVLTDSMPQLTWTCRPDGQCESLNRQWVLYTGIQEVNQLGFGWLEQLHPEDRLSTSQLWRERVAAGLPFNTQFRIRSAGGEYRWFQTHAVPIHDAQGRVERWLGSSSDIQAIRTSEERYELAVRGSEAGLWDWNIVTDEVFYSPRFKSMLGHAGDSFPNVLSSFIDALHPEDVEPVRQALAAHLTDPEQRYDIEYRLKTHNGDYRFIQANGVAVRDDLGRPCRMAGSIIDVTDRRQAEFELQAAAELLRQFIAHTPAAVAMLDKNMCYLQTSKRWLQDYKLGDSMIVGKSHYDVFPDIPARWKELHQRVLNGETLSCDEDPFERRDGTVEWLQWEARPWRKSTDEIGGIILFTQVITSRKRVESDLIAAREQAMTASRIKGDFLANMSHEIRTPLTAILGYVELLEDQGLSAAEHQAHLATIRGAGDHLLAMVNDVLDLSKIEAGQLLVERTEFSPAQIVAEVLTFFQGRAKSKGLALTLAPTESIPRTICSDPMRVRQILVNLVGNAVKFTERGKVEICLRLAGENTLAFEVHDTGVGIPQEQQGELFAPFVQADPSTTRKFGGTGLGLTICRRMAQMLGGDVTFTSVAGQGSTFTATVDFGSVEDVELGGMAVRIPEIEQASATLRLSGRILVAEDNPTNQYLVKELLTKAGANVDVVDNGRQAVDRVSLRTGSESPGVETAPAAVYDLILMDMQMPILDGCSATRELRQNGYMAPIVALTANAMEEDRSRCLAAGCNDFATKPFDRTELIRVCHKWMSVSHTASGGLEPVKEAADASSVVDSQALLHLVDHDLQLLEQIVGLYFSDSAELMEQARRGLERGDLQQVKHTAHRLKGVVSILQAGSAFQTTRRLEEAGCREDVDGLVKELAQLQTELNRLNPALRDLLCASNLSNGADQPGGGTQRG